VEVVALIRRVFLRLVVKTSDLLLEQRMNIKFHAKLEKDACGTCKMFSKAYGGEAMKKSSVSERHKLFKKGHEKVEHKESAHHFL
jgi:hypothetical protein